MALPPQEDAQPTGQPGHPEPIPSPDPGPPLPIPPPDPVPVPEPPHATPSLVAPPPAAVPLVTVPLTAPSGPAAPEVAQAEVAQSEAGQSEMTGAGPDATSPADDDAGYPPVGAYPGEPGHPSGAPVGSPLAAAPQTPPQADPPIQWQPATPEQPWQPATPEQPWQPAAADQGGQQPDPAVQQPGGPWWPPAQTWPGQAAPAPDPGWGQSGASESRPDWSSTGSPMTASPAGPGQFAGAPHPAAPFPGAPYPGAPDGEGQPPWQVSSTAPPKRRRTGLWVSLALVITVLLCGGGGVSAFLLLRNAESGDGAPDPATAVELFMTAVYRDRDASAASDLVCSESRDARKISSKVDEVKAYDSQYDRPQYAWEDPSVADESKERATVSVALTMTTRDEKTAQQQLSFTVVKKTGWWVCEIAG